MAKRKVLTNNFWYKQVPRSLYRCQMKIKTLKSQFYDKKLKKKFADIKIITTFVSAKQNNCFANQIPE